MWKETNVLGVYLSPLVVYMGAALLLYLPLRWMLTIAGILPRVWNPPLAEAGLYACILGLLLVYV